MTLSAQDIQRMSLLAMNAEMEPGHRFVNDLGDALQDALDEIERLRELLAKALPWVTAHQEYESTEPEARALASRMRDAAGLPPER